MPCGNVVFTPTANYTGAASFSYTVSDGHGGTATTSASLTVTSTTMTGTPNADQITVAPGTLTVNALGGDDTITLTSGTYSKVVQIHGGAGSDTVNLSSWTSATTIDLSQGPVTVGGTRIATLDSIENATGGTGNDTITGSDSANKLDGGAGADRISAGGGNDTILGGAGNDTLTGGSGNDSFIFVRGKDVITDFHFGNNGRFNANAHDALDFTGLAFHFQGFTDLLNHTSNDAAGYAVIHIRLSDAATETIGSSFDTLTLSGVSTAQLASLQAHVADFHF